ncbi:MAG: branched-chain amino acid ABC transporter permease, partial [candidate division NC10 bacterium]|nr:branched-chain amino acid ABC transporter permease [candidate division NC10 bacterium]
MREWLATRLREPRMAAILSIGMIAVSAALAANYSRSLLAFLLFQASILVLYFARMTRWLKMLLAGLALGILMPTLGTINGYYLEVATQVGIFVALALGLNIVVGLAGLLDLGYVAFYAVGAYTWAIFGSPQAGQFIPESVARFPLGGQWFFLFLLLGVMVAGTTGVILGLPVLRLRGDYLAIVTLGFGEVIRVLANNLDKPINFTNGPKGITPITRPPLFFQPLLDVLGIDAAPPVLYPIYFYFLVLLIVGVVI